MKKIGFLGLGKMGSAILSGMLSGGKFNPQNIFAYDPHHQDERIQNLDSEEALYDASDVLILAIKPQLFSLVLPKLQNRTHQPLLISIAGGITLAALEEALPNLAIIRIMPNLAATINESVSVYSKNSLVHPEDEALMIQIFSSIGAIKPIREDQMDGVVGLNGSFPAYLYYFLEAMIEAAIQDGFDPEMAKDLIIETSLASLHLAMKDGRTLTQLITDICSPRGITLEGIQAMKDANLQAIMMQVYQASKKRSIELGQKK